MNIKVPAVYDLSDYIKSIDWKIVNPKPLLVINRASLGLYYTDKKFAEFTTLARQAGIHVGAYHYYTAANDPKKQAEKFVSVVTPYLSDDMLLALDVEEQGISAGMMWTWLEYVRARCPKNLLIIYSRKNILDPIVMTQGEKDYFKKVYTWTAGYPNNSDLFNSVPSAYIPDQTKYGKVILWQYGLNDFVPGIIGETDLNYITPEFLQILGAEDPPQPQETITPLSPGVTQYSGARGGWRYWLHVVDKGALQYQAVQPAASLTVSSVAKMRGAFMAWNGSDYDRTTHALHVGAPSFYESGDVRNDSNGSIYSVSKLIENGTIHPRVYWTDATATEGHSRTCWGETADGKTMIMVSEGKYPNQGLRLRDNAEIMQAHGAVIAGSSGGGGDTTLVIDGKLINVPENFLKETPDVFFERPIPQVLLAYVGTQTGGTSMSYYAGTIASNVTAKVWDRIGGTVIKDLKPGTVVKGDAPRSDGYTLLSSPVVGYTKTAWLSGYKEVAVTPPPTPEPTPTALPDVIYIATKADMSDRVTYRKAA